MKDTKELTAEDFRAPSARSPEERATAMLGEGEYCPNDLHAWRAAVVHIREAESTAEQRRDVLWREAVRAFFDEVGGCEDCGMLPWNERHDGAPCVCDPLRALLSGTALPTEAPLSPSDPASPLTREREENLRLQKALRAAEERLGLRDRALAACAEIFSEAVKMAEVEWDPRTPAATVQRGIARQIRAARDRALTSGASATDRSPPKDTE